MRRILLSLILLVSVSPAFSRNDFEYNSTNYNSNASFSFDQFDRTYNSGAYRVMSLNQPAFSFDRSPVRIPSVNIDFSFHNTFSFSALDLRKQNFDSFATTRFSAQPVVRFDKTYADNKNTGPVGTVVANFQSPNQTSLGNGTKLQSIPTTSVTTVFSKTSVNSRSVDITAPKSGPLSFREVPQQSVAMDSLRNSTGYKLFNAVSSMVKAVPTFFQTVGQKIGELGHALWNRVVLGQRTVPSYPLGDGSVLKGAITVNRKDALVSVAPGTVRTVGEVQETKTGPTLVSAKTPVKINERDYLQGQFVYDGKNYNLTGPGIRVTNEARPNIETDAPYKVYVNGDGKGGETVLGLGAMSSNTTFKETTSGLIFKNLSGLWALNANQAGNLNVNGQRIPVTINEKGRLDQPTKADLVGSKVPQTLAGILPNPETGGFQLTGIAEAGKSGDLSLGIPGTRPSQYTAGQINDWRQETSVFVKQSGFEGRPKTDATLHQEGDRYVFTKGDVAFVAITGVSGENKSQGQKTLYAEPIFDDAAKLTITGPTEFPNYGVTVIAGKVSLGGRGVLDIENKTLYHSNTQGDRLTIKLGKENLSIPVKDIDLNAGTFVATLPEITFSNGEQVKPERREVRGRIDFKTGQAALVDTATKGPIVQNRSEPGWFKAGPEPTGNGYVVIKDNTISVNTDRLVNLDSWKTVEPRQDVLSYFASPRYDMAMEGFTNPDNGLFQRSASLALAVSIFPLKAAEDAVGFSVNCHHPAREFALYSILAVTERSKDEQVLNGLKATESLAEFFVRAEPLVATSLSLAKTAVTEIVSLAKALKGEAPALLQPVMNESGKVLVPGTAATNTTTAIMTPRSVALQSGSEAAMVARNAVEKGAPLYRGGSLGKSNTGPTSQFWSMENPTGPRYAQRYGIPESNTPFDFVETARIKPGAQFVTREAPGLGANGGGAIEVVIEENGVVIDAFSSFKRHR